MRLFIAIDLPESVRAKLVTLLQSITKGKTMPLGQIHLTLRFLGEISTESLRSLSTSLQRIQEPAFKLKIQGLACFPHAKHPRILWAGLKPCVELLTLKEKLDQALLKFGIKPEQKKFHPHLTLARFKRPQPDFVRRFIQEHAKFELDSFKVEAFYLYSSELRRQGAIHRKELKIPLITSCTQSV